MASGLCYGGGRTPEVAMKEMQELESSNRNKVIIGVLAAVGIAAGIYFAFGTSGTGEPEVAHRLMIVADRTVDLHAYTAELGFEAVGGSFEAWQDQIVEQEEGYDDPGEVDLQAMLAFADRFGYGFVVVEEPQRFELASLGLEFSTDAALGHQDPASIPDRVRFGVISIGDFAGPHVLTTELSGRDVHEGARDVEVGTGAKALRALFAQPELAPTLDAQSPSTATQTLRLKLLHAIEALEKNERLELKAAGFADREREQIEAIEVRGSSQRAVPLVHALEGASVFPLADGRMLVRSTQARPKLRRDELAVEFAPLYTYSAIPAGAPAQVDARVPCPEFMGGGGPRRELARFEVSAAGDALFLLDDYGEGQLFAFDPSDPSLGACGLRSVAKYALSEHTDSYFSVHRRGVATRDVVDGALVVDVVDPEGNTTRLGAGLQADNSSSLIWLDDEGRRVGVLVDFEDDTEALAVLDRQHPERVLLVPLADPGDPELNPWSREIQRIPGTDEAPAFVYRWYINEVDYALTRVDLGRPWAAIEAELFGEESPEKAGGDELPETALAPTTATVPLETITWTPVLNQDSHIRGYAIHPRGDRVAMTVEGDLGVDVAVVPLPARGAEPGPRRLIIDDALEHREVAFRFGTGEDPSADLLSFRTRLRLEVEGAYLFVAHAAPAAP
ncbi:hypothetical protein PPSIR1_15770 [Plesiocystis pacifica SIR-1]|uniref:Uncharacterized protein n=2 Tax=Plesiocystis pacifica TaxID=191768 RepID=A6GEN0_9BACT|nr:hypothetical protein PPSIR1_15770 [Plesiocystis pacifica SIR-1]